jgi:hypothetical protein
MMHAFTLACLSTALLCACAASPTHRRMESGSLSSTSTSSTADPISEVTKAKDLKELEEWASKYPRERTLVVFDIDDTLLTTPEEPAGGRKFFGSDRWYVWQAYGIPKESEHRIGNCLFEVISTNALTAKQEETQDDAIEILMRLPNDKLMLTSRGRDMKAATDAQLRAVGYQGIPSLTSKATPLRITADGVDGTYDNGVFLTQGAHKGKALVALLNDIGRGYDYVILIDDTEKNVLNMAVSMALKRVNYVGIRYTGVKGDPPNEVTPEQVQAHKRDWQELRARHGDLTPRWDAGACP